MKILVVDDSKDFRALARGYLAKKLPDAEVIEYEIEKVGKPTDDFDWSQFDVLLLDYNLGGGEDGFSWLKEFKRKPGFPPTIILTAEGDEYIAVKAIKLGAADYMNKVDVSPSRLAEAVLEATEYTTEKVAEQEKEKVSAEEIVKDIHEKEKKVSVKDKIDIGYKFVRIIGQGAMSSVYLAERKSDRLSLVLKILDISKSPSPSIVQRFIREAELIAGIESPFIVKIYDHGLTDDYGFIAMEFFSRGDLKQRMELKLTPEIAFNYMTHIAYGLDAIHKTGIVHRDLKPANLMFRGDDSLVLADFGISKRIDINDDLTTMGEILGTPHYMSPEQGEGREIDTRADIYSAGVLLYELLTNDKPFTANTPAALVYQHLHGEIPKLPYVLSPYQDIIDRAMAKKPEDRYQTTMDFIKVLEIAEQSLS
jgi:DNA-binding response OmpR family regulator